MKRGKKYINILLLLVFSLFITWYTYNKNKPVLDDELLAFSGILLEKPFQGEQGGDMPEPFIRIKLKDVNKNFYFMLCSYDASRIEELLELKKGMKIHLFISKKDVKKRDVDVYQLIANNEFILDVNDYNNCYTNRWRGLLKIDYFIGAIFFVLLFYDIVKFIQQSHSERSLSKK
jgi:hypothetical protein